MSGIDFRLNPSRDPLLPGGAPDIVAQVLVHPKQDETLGACRGIAVSLLIGLAGWTGLYFLVRLILA